MSRVLQTIHDKGNYILRSMLIQYNKITLWTMQRSYRRFRKHYRNLHYLLNQSSQSFIHLKFDSEICYLFLELFYLLLAWPLGNRINRKRNSLFPNRI